MKTSSTIALFLLFPSLYACGAQEQRTSRSDSEATNGSIGYHDTYDHDDCALLGIESSESLSSPCKQEWTSFNKRASSSENIDFDTALGLCRQKGLLQYCTTVYAQRWIPKVWTTEDEEEKVWKQEREGQRLDVRPRVKEVDIDLNALFSHPELATVFEAAQTDLDCLDRLYNACKKVESLGHSKRNLSQDKMIMRLEQACTEIKHIQLIQEACAHDIRECSYHPNS